MRTSTILSTLLLLAPWGALPAQAQDAKNAEVEAIYAEGAALYRAGKYRAAIERFERAYALYPEPNLLYNIGRSHEALGELDQALSAYDRCLAASDLSPDLRLKTNERRTLVMQAKRNSETAPVDLKAPPPAAPAAITTTSPPPRSGGLTIAKWSAGAVGIGLLAAGGVFYALGAGDHGKVEDAKAGAAGGNVANLSLLEAQALVDDGEQKKTLGVALAAGGLGAVGIAAVLFIMDTDDDPKMALVPLADGAQWVMGGRF
jgi:hypothetical protein